LADFVATVAETDEGEDEDGEGEDDRRQIRVGKDAAVEALMRAIRRKARAKAIGRCCRVVVPIGLEARGVTSILRVAIVYGAAFPSNG
jgi:hypothetical protein